MFYRHVQWLQPPKIDIEGESGTPVTPTQTKSRREFEAKIKRINKQIWDMKKAGQEEAARERS